MLHKAPTRTSVQLSGAVLAEMHALRNDATRYDAADCGLEAEGEEAGHGGVVLARPKPATLS